MAEQPRKKRNFQQYWPEWRRGWIKHIILVKYWWLVSKGQTPKGLWLQKVLLLDNLGQLVKHYKFVFDV